ncbi:MAG TPA: hypothetical protein PLN34_00660 [Alloprevotella sp.]|nr:hypothetical protein [Alloprevotella sp.]
MGPFLKKIGCFFHVKRRKKPPDRRFFRVVLLCWCKYTAFAGEKQMLINLLLDSKNCPSRLFGLFLRTLLGTSLTVFFAGLFTFLAGLAAFLSFFLAFLFLVALFRLFLAVAAFFLWALCAEAYAEQGCRGQCHQFFHVRLFLLFIQSVPRCPARFFAGKCTKKTDNTGCSEA